MRQLNKTLQPTQNQQIYWEDWGIWCIQYHILFMDYWSKPFNWIRNVIEYVTVTESNLQCGPRCITKQRNLWGKESSRNWETFEEYDIRTLHKTRTPMFSHGFFLVKKDEVDKELKFKWWLAAHSSRDSEKRTIWNNLLTAHFWVIQILLSILAVYNHFSNETLDIESAYALGDNLTRNISMRPKKRWLDSSLTV